MLPVFWGNMLVLLSLYPLHPARPGAMAGLEERILQTYRRLGQVELQQVQREATRILMLYTERLRMLENMDDRLELARTLRANPNEEMKMD